MNKVTRVKHKDFTVISNVFLRDKNLSIKAKGFLAVVMGLPEDWEFSINGICAILKEGKTAIYNVIDELKGHGYCVVKTNRDSSGKIVSTDYTFLEQVKNSSTHYSEPLPENPYMDNPNMDNQPQLNIEITNDLKDKEVYSRVNDFVDRMYEIYPARCPKRNASTGKSRKDKDRIKRLLKVYTEEQIEQVIRAEVDEKYEKQYMQNFSTFLNSIPFRSDDLFESRKVAVKKDENVITINGVTYK